MGRPEPLGRNIALSNAGKKPIKEPKNVVTIAEYYASGQIETFDDDILLAMWESLSTEVQRQRWEMRVIEMVLQHRMQENNAKKLLSTTLSVELGSPG